MNTQTDSKKAFEEAIANMTLPANPYFKEYVFYMHLISQCRVIFDESLPAAAGVTFKHDHYILCLNPKEIIGEGIDEKGNPTVIQGFSMQMPLKQRMGILKHEMLHIGLGHLLRVEDRNFKLFNYASDCAINQEITKDHLPDYAIRPENFPSKKPAPPKQTAEFYYDLLEEEKSKQPSGKEGQKGGKGELEAGDKTPQNRCIDDHSLWEQVEGDITLQKELTKNMVERAADSAQKQRGTLPQSYAQMIENLTINREVNWKQVLRSIVGNKKANLRKTIMRKDRRLPLANWLKGKQKDRIFALGVISDVSGSVNDKAQYKLWGAIIHICKLFETDVNLVQVDTEAFPPEKLTSNTKTLERKACGGTILNPAIQSFADHNVHFDALVITTDGYLSESDVDHFAELRKPVIWLIEENGQILENMNAGKMHAIKLTGENDK